MRFFYIRISIHNSLVDVQKIARNFYFFKFHYQLKIELRFIRTHKLDWLKPEEKKTNQTFLPSLSGSCSLLHVFSLMETVFWGQQS